MPLEKYYCDYCDRTINDNAESRRTHFDSSSHKRCVKMHYDSLQDTNEMNKNNSLETFNWERTMLCPNEQQYGVCGNQECGFYHIPSHLKVVYSSYYLINPLSHYPLSSLPPSLHPPSEEYENDLLPTSIPDWG